MKKGFREERDGVGKILIPENAEYGSQTARAAENFRITGRPMHPLWIENIVLIKKAAAIVNRDNGYLAADKADAIVSACGKIMKKAEKKDFPVDAIQGGAGTSANMNVNEVVANKAIAVLGGRPGDYSVVHPNDHVNMHQSTNDVIPTSGKMTVIVLAERLCTELENLLSALEEKKSATWDIIKVGRTQLQDAVPMRVGQAFGAYATMVRRDISRLNRALECMHTVNMGATAIGSAINVEPGYLRDIVPVLSELFGRPLKPAADLFDGTQNIDCFAEVSATLKLCAVDLSKMSDDLRLLGGGPVAGLAEFRLPPRQNGSSIMPGKINPVIPEVVNQAAFLVIGNDVTVTMAAEAGQLELNAFEPVVFDRLFESITALSGAVNTLTEHCIRGITVNEERCRWYLEHSMATVTALSPMLGYQKTSDVAHEALDNGETVLDIVRREKLLDEETLGKVLDPVAMTEPKK